MPRQKQPLWRLPSVLLNWEFAPAWPRMAALACCAALGFVVGIAGLDRPFDRLDAIRPDVGSRDIGSFVSEPESLTGNGHEHCPGISRDGSRLIALAAAGLAGAQLVLRWHCHRHDGAIAGAPSWDRNVFVRVERLAATLPPADADILRGEINTNRTAIENAQAAYHAAQDSIHKVLRQEPFDAEAMRAAMAKTRAARLDVDQTIQGVFAVIAAKISPAGRQALANWPPGRKAAASDKR